MRKQVWSAMIQTAKRHEATVNITLDMSDYGTTKPERVDISTLPNVEYSDNSEVHTYYGYYE